MMFDIVPLATPQMVAGKVRALAVTALTCIRILPNVPTMTEIGLPGVQGGP